MLGLGCHCDLCFILGFFVKVKLIVPLLCVCMCIFPGKAIPVMTCNVSGGTSNPMHSRAPPPLIQLEDWGVL